MGLGQGKTAGLQRVNQRDALRPIGDIERPVQVVQEHADDFPEAQRDDGEIVAAQAQRRCAEQDPEKARNRGAQRQQHQERPVYVELRRCQQGVAVGANGKKCDIAEIEQAGEAHHDVQPQREHDEQQRYVGDAHPGASEQRLDQERRGQQQQRQPGPGDPAPGIARLQQGQEIIHARSPLCCPINPDGRSTSTRISTRNANTSR